MLKALFIRSGSTGNATLITDGTTLVLIDMGLTKKLLKEGCAVFDKKIEDIDAAFFTHAHSDHTSGSRFLKGVVPCFASEGTLDEPDFTIEEGVAETIGDITVLPFGVSHDAPNPVNYLILCKGEKFAYVTDTGYLSEENLALLHNCDYYLIESNHDIKMEVKSHRPKILIKRVLSDLGHLSNIDSAKYMVEMMGNKTKGIYLAHLSDECNTHDIALSTHRRVYEEAHIDWTSLDLRCTSETSMVKGGDWE